MVTPSRFYQKSPLYNGPLFREAYDFTSASVLICSRSQKLLDPRTLQTLIDITPRGFTGHEHVDSMGIIHMNGRIYDAQLGRFLQADPFIEDTSTLNRYTYVHNNPLAYTDPSGYLSFKEFARIAIAVAITVYSGGSAKGLAWGLWGKTVTTGQALATVAVGGVLSNRVATGSWSGSVTAAFTAMAFYGVGQGLKGAEWAKGDFVGELSGPGLAAKTVSHGLIGGISAELQGGQFGHGFLSSGATASASPYIDGAFNGDRFLQGMTAAMVGGTVSELTGGKFANGAVSAAMAFAFNQAMSGEDSESSDSEWTEDQTKKAVGEAAAKYLKNVQSMSFDEFNEAFPNWRDNSILSALAMSNFVPGEIVGTGYLMLRDQGQLGKATIDGLRQFTSEQIAEIYGDGITGAALGKLPKTQAAWNIYTHPQPPGWQFWKSQPSVTISCNMGSAQCGYTVN